MKRAAWIFGTIAVLVVCLHRPMMPFLYKAVAKYKLRGAETIVHPGQFDMDSELQRLHGLATSSVSRALDNAANVALLEARVNERRGLRRSYLLCELAYQYMLAGDLNRALGAVDAVQQGKHRLGRGLFRCMNYIVSTVYTSSYFHRNIHRPDRLRGLLYFRLAEAQNCQEPSVAGRSSSCSLPVNPDALYRNTFGLEQAVFHFERDFSAGGRPDYTTRWLYNLAHALMGTYPEAIPEQLLIDFEANQEAGGLAIFREKVLSGLPASHHLYGGSIMEDINRDGNLNLILTSGSLADKASLFTWKCGKAKTTGDEQNMDGITGGANIIYGDYDNDGLVDLYVLRGGWLSQDGTKYPNSLLKQLPQGGFTDVTAQAGLLSYGPGHSAVFADFNNDGWLDLFVGNELFKSHLFLNQGDGTFAEVAAGAGIRLNAFVKGAVALDVNQDGWMDLYVSCFNGPNRLYVHEGRLTPEGIPLYSERASEYGIRKPWSGFSVVAFDFNNDGLTDLFCPEYNMDMDKYIRQLAGRRVRSGHSRLYLNQGNGRFKALKSPVLDRVHMAMGLNYGDLNNDGWPDLYLGTGYPDFSVLVPNTVLINREGKELFDATFESGLGKLQKGHGIAIGDVDHDGDNDILLNSGGFFEADRFPPSLYLNNGNRNNSITIRLEGHESNFSAIGARLELEIIEDGERRHIYRNVHTGGSYGASPLTKCIGTGSAEVVSKLTIGWPGNRSVQTFYDLPVSAAYLFCEGSEKYDARPYRPLIQ